MIARLCGKVVIMLVESYSNFSYLLILHLLVHFACILLKFKLRYLNLILNYLRYNATNEFSPNKFMQYYRGKTNPKHIVLMLDPHELTAESFQWEKFVNQL